MNRRRLGEALYARLVGQADAPACAGLQERAGRAVPGNFLLLIASHFFSKLAATLTTGVGLLVFPLDSLRPAWLGLGWMLPALYFCLSIAHQGVRIGRKTYVVDLARGNRRTDYVAVGNSLIGVILLLLGFAGAPGVLLAVSQTILLLSLLGALGALLAAGLPEAE